MSKRGLILPELAAAGAVVVVLFAIIGVLADSSRRSARIGDDLNKLRWQGSATGSYVMDHDGRFWGWENTNSDDGYQSAWDAFTQIVRERSGWTDFEPEIPQDRLLNVHRWNAHVLLAEYMDVSLPHEVFISSGDWPQLERSADPQSAPDPNTPTLADNYWAFKSSFIRGPAFWSEPFYAVYPSTDHNRFFVGSNARFVGQRLSDVAYPSDKVHQFTDYSWHFMTETIMPPGSPGYAMWRGRVPLYFRYPEARVTASFVDGRAELVRTGDANKGWRPDNPTAPNPLGFYSPDPRWEPPTLDGADRDLMPFRFQWTRAGLGGRDFGGPDINTGQR